MNKDLTAKIPAPEKRILEQKKMLSKASNTLQEDANGRIRLNLNPIMYDILCTYVVSDNKYIKNENLYEIKTLLNMADPAEWELHSEKSAKVNFIKRALEARLDKKIKDPKMIMQYASGGPLKQSMIDEAKVYAIKKEEIDYVNEAVASIVKTAFLNKNVNNLIEEMAEYRACNPNAKIEEAQKIIDHISQFHGLINKHMNDNSQTEWVSLDQKVLRKKMAECYDQVTNANSKLKTGIKKLNVLLGGGFEFGRIYCFFALQGEGKSITLLNLCYQLKMYNKGYVCKDPKRKPCIVYITQENSENETIERLYAIATKEDFGKSSFEDTIRKAKYEGFLEINQDNPIDIIIIYKPMGNTTDYLYETYEALWNQGYEPIVYAHDYLARIHSVDRNMRKDARFEYGAVTDEEKKFAMEKGVVFLTAGQINRSGAQNVDHHSGRGKLDLLTVLARDNIAESMLILNNVDGAFLLAKCLFRDYTGQMRKYLGIKRIKNRYRASNLIDHVYQPYTSAQGISLSEDEYLDDDYGVDSLEEIYKKSIPKEYKPQTTEKTTNAVDFFASDPSEEQKKKIYGDDYKDSYKKEIGIAERKKRIREEVERDLDRDELANSFDVTSLPINQFSIGQQFDPEAMKQKYADEQIELEVERRLELELNRAKPKFMIKPEFGIQYRRIPLPKDFAINPVPCTMVKSPFYINTGNVIQYAKHAVLINGNTIVFYSFNNAMNKMKTSALAKKNSVMKAPFYIKEESYAA